MNCPVCGTERFSEWGRSNGYVIQQCQACGLGVTTPFPESDGLAEVNRETYLLDQRVRTYLGRRAYFEKRYHRQLDDIRSFHQGGRLLDIGCNIGMFLIASRSAGFDVCGVELNRDCAEYARASFGLDVRSVRLEDAGFPPASFDVVTMYDVLEHVPDLRGMLASIRGILKPGGLLVVQSPNLDSVMADMTKSAWSWLSPPDHLYHFTPDSLSALLDHAGYAIARIKTWEPADAFCMDVMQARFGNSLPARMARKVIRLSGIAELLVSLAQKTWWHRRRGALVEVYAITPADYLRNSTVAS